MDRTSLDIDALIDFVATQGHNGALGFRRVGHGADWCSLAFDPIPELVGDEKRCVLASGPILALMDMAAATASWIRLGGFRPQATLDFRIDYMRAARGGTVIGRAECYRQTPTIAFVRGIAHEGDEADPVANVAGAYMFTDQ